MDYTTGTPLTDDDRRSTKRRKPCSASSSDSDFTIQPSKLTKDDYELNSGSKNLTCDELGYSNFPGGNSLHSLSYPDQRQVASTHSSTNVKETVSSSNVFDPPIDCCVNNTNTNHEVYYDTEFGEKGMNVKSLDCEIRESNETGSCSGETMIDTDSCSITYVKTLDTEQVYNSPKSNVSPRAKPIGLTDLVKTLFSPATADTFKQRLLGQPIKLSDTTDIANEGTEETISRENNLYLKDLVRNNRVTLAVLDSIYNSVNECSSNLSLMSTRMAQHEKFVEKNIKSTNARFEANESKIAALSLKVDQNFSEIHLQVDQRIQSITAEFPGMLSKMERDVDTKIDLRENKIQTDFHSQLSKVPTLNDVKDFCDSSIRQCVNEGKLVSRTDLIEINRKLEALSVGITPLSDDKFKALETEITNLKRKNKDLETSLNSLHTNPPTGALSESDKKNWENFKSKTEAVLDDLPTLKGDLAESLKTVRSLDVRSRRQNLVIDQLSESENEDTQSALNKILDHALSVSDRQQVEILKAFRLGVKSVNGPPRKILVELSTPKGRDIILENARNISRIGNEGKIYYVNEDLPDDIKRRKSDLHKYVLYLRDRNHQANKIGDDIIIDGKRYKFEELNTLPVGLRFMDSRTIFNNGIVAFQSSVSPLSNLFPCKLKYAGRTYNSLEQCYQYHRAIHHQRTQLAALILATNDPYKAMYHGKSIVWENRDWEAKKLGTMEMMLKHKAEQSEMFRDLLKFTGNHKLAENSWNYFWGTGCGFLSDQVWVGNFRGGNHLGRLLERVRSSI